MRTLEEDDDDAFKRQFSQYIKNGITADSVSIHTFYLHIQSPIRPAYNYCKISWPCSVAVGQ